MNLRTKALAAFAVVLSAVAPVSHAAIDIAPVVTEIDSYVPLIASVGGSVLIVGLAVAGIKWVRSAFGR